MKEEEVRAPSCGRENELIAFLYGELDAGETEGFHGHMIECADCRNEIERLRDVRESVVSWRNESLGGVRSPYPVASSVAVVDPRRPSALAALRQFFDLSPVWMKGAVVFASLLFCLFAGLAVARLRETPSAPVVNNPDSSRYSEQEIKAMIDRRVQEELQRIKNSPEQVMVAPTVADNPRQSFDVPSVKRSAQVASEVTTQKARRPLTKSEREQLAADLRLVLTGHDTELDLLDDRINQ